ncbi:MAG: exosporium glycoprotein BclB-related protein [Sporosarcina sp.]
MSSNNFQNHGCSGCGGSNHHSSGCFRSNTGKINCNFGPFTAIDAACISTPPSGRTPATSAGALIAFASGTPAVLTSIVGGLVETPAMIGFGTNLPLPTIVGNTVNLTPLVNEAFSVARAGTLTAISASYTVAAGLALGTSSVTVNAQIWRAPAGSNTFSPTTASVNLDPSITGLTVLQTLYGQSESFTPVPLAFGDRLLMVFSATSVGPALAVAITGTASAGINIE